MNQSAAIRPNGPSNNSGLLGWFARRGWWARFGLAILAGVAMTGGHPPVSVPWILFLAVPVLVLLLATAPRGRSAAWIGWGAAFGYFVSGLHWMGHAFLVEPEKFAWLLPLGVTALPAFLGLFWALAFWVVWRLCRGAIIPVAFGLSGALTLVEFARSNVLTGFPWALPGYIWVDLPPMQAAAWIGPFGVTLATLMITALPAGALTAGGRVLALLAMVAGAGFWTAGSLRIPEDTAYRDDAPVLRIVQPNAPQHLKWAIGHREKYYDRMLAATNRPPDPAFGPPDIVIWPEASVYFIPELAPTEVAKISTAAGNAWVLLGAIHGKRTASGDRWTNALSTISPTGQIGPRYDKQHLVPFGEYLPVRPFFDALGISQFARQGDLAFGSGPKTMALGDLPSFRPLICYEAIFPGEIVDDQRPSWLVQPTNDAWFGGWAGPQQHYAQARIRAIEQGLPMIRAANTGISAIVDPFGREIAAIGLHRFDHLDGRLPKELGPTLYSRIGDWPAVIIAFLLLGLPSAWRERTLGALTKK